MRRAIGGGRQDDVHETLSRSKESATMQSRYNNAFLLVLLPKIFMLGETSDLWNLQEIDMH